MSAIPTPLTQQPARAFKTLTAEQHARYWRDGFLHPLPAIGAALAGETLQKIDAVQARHGGEWPKEQSFKPHTLYPWLDAIVRHPAILDAVEDILGPDILCWQSRFFIKDPNDGGFVSWHQDVTYWGVDITENILTAWVAFTPATPENGVMKVIPGSHKNKLFAHREGAGSKLTVRGQEVAVDVDESKAVYMGLDTGQMSLHHVLLFHGSAPNTSEQRRVGLAIRYLPTRAKALPGLPKDYVTLVRGVDRYHHFQLETPPVADLDPAAVAQHQITSKTYFSINAEAARRHDDMIKAQR
ncbi:MAG: phytanoyl-CoA dioxygenase [Betaproteobacteria bacterium]|nr:phytanoyl-CoA dioxygenase [Betaproteobacteria bacterium]